MLESKDVFITQFNYDKTLPKKIKSPNDETSKLIDSIDLINIFNKKELNYFIILCEALENPETLIQVFKEQYNDQKPDVYSSYHFNLECIELNKKYLDYTISSTDENLRIMLSSKIRNIFKEYTYSTSRYKYIFDFCLEKKEGNTVQTINEDGEIIIQERIPDDIYNQMMALFKKYDSDLGKSYHVLTNSGVATYNNLSLIELETKIEKLINDSISYRYSDESIAKKIKNITFADIYKLKKMDNEIAKKWVVDYKEPIYRLIQNYYWIKFNPKLSIDKTVLDSIGFKPCKRCIINNTDTLDR